MAEVNEFFAAIESGDVSCVRALLGRHPELLKAASPEGASPSLADRAVIESWSPDGWQPLHLAAFFGRAEAARALLDADAPVAEPSRNELAVQPLHAAAAGQHSELVWILIASDAPVQARQRRGWTPLHSAVANADVDSILALLSAGADPDCVNDDGKSPLDLSPTDAVRSLLQGSELG